MNILSPFDGMGCGQIALNKLNIHIDKYFASEIDKYAIKITQKNYPETIQIGDVLKVKAKNLPKIDLLIGGSPCQGFSFSGKGLNFDDPRSKLFFEFVRLLKECKPKWWLLENVFMKKEYSRAISKLLGIFPVLINSADFSAQNRKRYYWTNIPYKLFWKKSKAVIGDVLEEVGYDITNRYYAKKKGTLVYKKSRKQTRTKFDKSMTLLTENKGPGSNGTTCIFINKELIRKFTPIECERLQTIPDNYTKGVSDTQRYKMIGNGMTVSVIIYLLSGMKQNEP